MIAQYHHKPTMYEYLKEHCEYLVSPWGFLLGFAVAPSWMNVLIQNAIGIFAALVTVILTFFIKKWLERKFPKGIEFGIKLKKKK